MNISDEERISVISVWSAIIVALTIMAGLTYAAVQQDLRQSADDPQVQMAEDAAAKLQAGMSPQAITDGDKVDISQSLAPFVAIYGDDGAIASSSGTLGGAAVKPPSGIFTYVRKHGQERVTWEPKPGIRQALVVVRYTRPGFPSGFVISGRSLREVEKREERLLIIVFAAWMLAVLLTFVAAFFPRLLFEKFKNLPEHRH